MIRPPRLKLCTTFLATYLFCLFFLLFYITYDPESKTVPGTRVYKPKIPIEPHHQLNMTHRNLFRFGNNDTPSAFMKDPLFTFWDASVCEEIEKDFNQSDRKVVLILIASRPEKFEVRQMIRNSWARTDSYRNLSMHYATLFVVNKPSEFLTNSRLTKEARMRGDVIVVNLSPNYHMLTVQLLIGYLWVHYSCPRVDYILKVDDDTYTHLESMDKLIQSVQMHKPHHIAEIYGGQCYKNATVIRKGDKTPRSYQKWIVDRDTYGKDTFPRYCNGPAYFFSASLLPQIVSKCPYHCTGFPDTYPHPIATTHWSESPPITNQEQTKDYKNEPTQLVAPASNSQSYKAALNITNKLIKSPHTTANQPITSRNLSRPITNDSNCFWNWEDVFFGSCISTFEKQPYTNFDSYGYYLGGMPRLKTLDKNKPYAAIHPVKRARAHLALHKFYGNQSSTNFRAERVASVLASAKVV